jgi:TolB protein
MTPNYDVARKVGIWLRSERPTMAPEGLLDAIEREVATTPRRRGWLILDRWAWRHEATVRRVGAGLVLAALVASLILALILAIGIIGAARPAPPFGLARAGLIAVDTAEGIVVAQPDGTHREVLVPADGQSISPTWSRDGLHLAFWHRAEPAEPWSLVVVDARGGGRQVLADGITLTEREQVLSQPSNLSWSPGGHQIVYAADTGEGVNRGTSLFTVTLGETGPRRITDPSLHALDPAWAPNGRLIAFRNENDGTLHVVAPDGSGERRYSKLTGAGLWPDWSPDGSRLAVMALVGEQLDIFVVSNNGSVVTNVSHDAADEYSPSWSPDGSRLAWARVPVDRSARAWVVVADPDGPHLTEIREPADLAPPVWSPDGSRLYSYVQAADGTFQELIVIDPSGRVPILRLPADGNVGNGNWQRLP